CQDLFKPNSQHPTTRKVGVTIFFFVETAFNREIFKLKCIDGPYWAGGNIPVPFIHGTNIKVVSNCSAKAGVIETTFTLHARISNLVSEVFHLAKSNE